MSVDSAAERCDVCGVAIDTVHSHLANVVSRQLLCACRACYLLFTHDGSGGSRFRAVPDRYVRVAAGDLESRHWDALEIPIGIAFFFRSSVTGRMTAFYPSPAGATESELPLDAWETVAGGIPELGTLAADVEALLVRRQTTMAPNGGSAETTALIVPIDVCYELAGLVRQNWRGFQGGEDVWREIDALFARAIERADPPASSTLRAAAVPDEARA